MPPTAGGEGMTGNFVRTDPGNYIKVIRCCGTPAGDRHPARVADCSAFHRFSPLTGLDWTSAYSPFA
jgi:hypothetical protein